MSEINFEKKLKAYGKGGFEMNAKLLLIVITVLVRQKKNECFNCIFKFVFICI